MKVEIVRNPGKGFDRRFEAVNPDGGKGDTILIHNVIDPGFEPEALAGAVHDAIEKILKED